MSAYSKKLIRMFGAAAAAVAFVGFGANAAADDRLDCDRTAVDLIGSGEPMSRDETVAMMDRAFYESLIDYSECLKGTGGYGAQHGGAIGVSSVAATGVQGIEATSSPVASDASGVDSSSATSGPIVSLPDSQTETVDAPALGQGKVPEDLVDSNNDDVLMAQIRKAAMETEDPAVREKLWNQLREYKNTVGQ